MATTDDVCATGAHTTDGGKLPPFNLEFEASSPSHCEGRVEMAIEDLSDVGVAFERQEDADASDVHRQLTQLLEDAEEASEDPDAATVDRLGDKQLSALQDAVDTLTPCAEYRCECQSWEWESAKEYFNGELEHLGDQIWVLVRRYDDRGLDIVSDHLTIDTLFSALPISRNYGFDDVTLTWDGSRLTASFSGYPWGSDCLTATPLAGHRLAAYETWSSCDSDDADVMAGPLANLPESVLAAAVEVVENDEWNVSEYWFTQLLELLEPLDGNDTARQMAVAMFPDWEGRPADLARACLAIADDGLADAA